MRHAYLFQEGHWRASGTFTNEQGETFAVAGESVITHDVGVWRIERTLNLSADPLVSFHNDYEVTPFVDGTDFTTWFSDNPVLGRLSGNFLVIGDRILSVYRNHDAAHQGTECLWRVDEQCYGGVGALFRGAERVSSWEAVLRRIPEEEGG